jgi:hypothetical protein
MVRLFGGANSGSGGSIYAGGRNSPAGLSVNTRRSGSLFETLGFTKRRKEADGQVTI